MMAAGRPVATGGLPYISNTLALYIYDDKDRLIAIEKGGQTYYTHTNYRGDILAITDTNKTRVATYKYGPWGELLSSTGTFSQPFRYAGYCFDEETGLYYLKARYYSPELGKFLTKDTFEGFNNNPQSLNLYAYANGNPVMNVDPDGHWAQAVVGGVIGGAFGLAGYLMTTPKNQRNIRDAAINFGLGAVSGALISSVGGGAIVGAVGNIGFYIYSTPSSQRIFTGYLKNAAIGAAFGAASTKASNIVTKSIIKRR